VEDHEDFIVEKCICGRQRIIEKFKDIKDFVNKKVKLSKERITAILDSLKKHNSLKNKLSSLELDLLYLEEKKETIEGVLAHKRVSLKILPHQEFRVFYRSGKTLFPYEKYIHVNETDEIKITLYFDDEINTIDVEIWEEIDNDESWMLEIKPIWDAKIIIPKETRFCDKNGKEISIDQFLKKEIGNILVSWDDRLFHQEFKTISDAVKFFKNLNSYYSELIGQIDKVKKEILDIQTEIENFTFPEDYVILKELYKKYRCNDVFKNSYYEEDPYDGFFGGLDVSLEKWIEILINYS